LGSTSIDNMQKSSLRAFHTYMFLKLPAAWWTGVRVTYSDDFRTEVVVKYRWANQNPFGSIFWAVQGMAAELSTAVFLMQNIRKSHQAISMLVLQNQAVFKKKAKGRVVFRCSQGQEASAAVQKATETGEAVTLHLHSVGTDSQGDTVAEFDFKWTLKKKTK
jgi:hypothetical protein